MNEAIIRREIYRMLRYRYNLWPQHIPDVAGSKRPGVPDLIVMNPRGHGYYIEAKYLDPVKETSFAFSKIEDSQRNWLAEWEKVCPYGSYLGIGVNSKPRCTYIIPWQSWTFIEELVTPFQSSLPFHAGQGFSRELQDRGIDFRLLDTWKCYIEDKVVGLHEGYSGWILSDSTLELMGLQ